MESGEMLSSGRNLAIMGLGTMQAEAVVSFLTVETVMVVIVREASRPLRRLAINDDLAPVEEQPMPEDRCPNKSDGPM